MADYKIGYGKPPKGRPFEPGRSGNPNGRPKSKPNPLGEIVQEVLDAPMAYRENGKPKTASRREVAIRILVEKAVKGDVAAADLLLKKRRHALRHGQKGSQQLVVTGWLPDHPGQPGDQQAPGPVGPARASLQGPDSPGLGDPGQNRIADNEPPQNQGG